jgi:histone-lysine N-methyltransferase SETMAR
MFEKIHDIILDNPKIKLDEIVEIVNISKERVHYIIHEHLGIRKLIARWVPRLLTIYQKRQRVRASTRSLELFQRNPNEFLRRFITVDETWIYHYTPESQIQAKQWVEASSSAPKRPKT